MERNKLQIIENNYIYILVVIMLVGSALRFYGINFGLPDLLHPDEAFEINRALRLSNGSIDLTRAGKGGFYFFIFIELMISFIILYLIGLINSPLEFAYFFVSHEDIFYITARSASALIGVISLFVMYKIGQKNGGKIVGLIGAFLLCISGMNIVHSHYATVDVTLVFFLLITWYFILSSVEIVNRKSSIWIGFFAGLSVITKFPGIVILFPISFLYLIHLFKKTVSFVQCLKHFAFTIIIFIFIVFAGEPGYIKTASNFVKTYGSFFGQKAIEKKVNNSGYEGVEEFSKVNLYKFYAEHITKDIGLPIIIIFLLSLIFLLFRGSIVELLILAFLIPYFLAISLTTSGLYYGRYAMPLIPLIIIVTSRGIGEFIKLIKNKLPFFNNGPKQYIIFPLLLLICLPTISSALNNTLEFGKENPRVKAKKWIQNNIPAGSRILMEGSLEHRSQSCVQLVSLKSNIKEMIRELEDKDHGKKVYWELRSNYLDRLNFPRYDLVLIQNTEPWIEWERFTNSDIKYVVLDETRFQRKIPNRNDPEVSSREQFYHKLIGDPGFFKLIEISNRIAIFSKKVKN